MPPPPPPKAKKPSAWKPEYAETRRRKREKERNANIKWGIRKNYIEARKLTRLKRKRGNSGKFDIPK